MDILLEGPNVLHFKLHQESDRNAGKSCLSRASELPTNSLLSRPLNNFMEISTGLERENDAFKTTTPFKIDSDNTPQIAGKASSGPTIQAFTASTKSLSHFLSTQHLHWETLQAFTYSATCQVENMQKSVMKLLP